MINRFFFLFSALVFLFGNTFSGVASNSFLTHTQHTPIELRPISLDNSFQLASVCFLGVGDCDSIHFSSGDDNYEVSAETKCLEEGYTLTSCSTPFYPNNLCPYDSSYFKECRKDTDKACQNEGYVSSCPTGQKLNKSEQCPYNETYGSCCTEKCPDNSSTTCSGAVVGEDGCGYQCKNCDPCPGYYDCGGAWQYCTGTTCYADSSRCSVSCKSDYFPNECDNKSDCTGIYRNGYCSSDCSPQSCPDGYSTAVTSCQSGYTLSTSGKSYGLVCGKCECDDTCPRNYSLSPCSENQFSDIITNSCGNSCYRCYKAKGITKKDIYHDYGVQCMWNQNTETVYWECNYSIGCLYPDGSIKWLPNYYANYSPISDSAPYSFEDKNNKKSCEDILSEAGIDKPETCPEKGDVEGKPSYDVLVLGTEC